ncbi:MAG: hypothetical protein Q7T21_01020 [Gallionella sp.]|nr:hypothetical protein [Gallionella sp.]
MKNNSVQFELLGFINLANENFTTFINHARSIAANAGLRWSIELDATGVACAGQEWDLRKMANDGRPKSYVLRTFSHFRDAQERMVIRGLLKPESVAISPVSESWQDLIKAHTIQHVLVRKKSLSYIGMSSAAWRFLATISGKEPWQVTSDDVLLACEISEECQSTKNGRSIVLIGLIRSFVDPLHLFDACPLASLVNRHVKGKVARAKFAQIEDKLAKTLSERKSEEKLPERRAFWELVRIVFTEKPLTLNDALRFAMVKLLLITGLRVGEVALLPFDWKRTRTYLDESGKPAGESGGISESLMIRHFAEKQGTALLYETTQFVPDMFRDELERTLELVARLTAPLRDTLKAQYETGRIFPQYRPEQLVDTVEMYVHLTGNPVWEIAPWSRAVKDCLARYRDTLDHSALLQLPEIQKTSTNLTAAVSRYFSQEKRTNGMVLRDATGQPDNGQGVRGKFLRVSDAEAYVSRYLPTKVSDLAPLTLDSGRKLAPWELLFLLPKRAVGAGRGDSVLDPTKTFSVGIADEVLLMSALGGETREAQSLFLLYGQTEADHDLKIKTHSFRHLQNTELFRLGVADTIITKRFNRRSVAQSYEYDHRSLAEEMDQIELPDEWALTLGESKAASVAKLITAGRANGPIVREFKHIQAKEGDDAALRFLAAEAGGFHATPYGTCLNSFTVDPCPKHLECFNNCRHLSATGLPEQQKNLAVLHGRLKAALAHALSRPDGAVGRTNQIAHAQVRLEGVEKLQITPVGQAVFPDGVDHSLPTGIRSVLHGT